MAKQKNDGDPVAKILAAIKAKAGKSGDVRLMSGGIQSDIDDVLPTGIDVLDHYVLSVGGWPVGRIVELYADEGVGKSSLLYQSIAGAQREGAQAVLYETERSIEAARPAVFGVDTNRLIGDQPDTMEDVLAMIEYTLDALPKSGKGDPAALIGWDSLAGTPTKAEIKLGLTGKAAVADRARLMSMAMRILTRKVADKRAVLVIVNQSRSNIGSWGGGSTTPGGKALKFHASVRLEMFSGKSIKDEFDRHVGKQVTLMATKTKIGGSPYAKAKVRLFYDTGWNNTWSTIWHAKNLRLVEKGASYTEETYLAALRALKWPRGFASGASPVGELVEEGDAGAPGGDAVDREFLGDAEDDL
jgi:recombination protein RecA